MKFTNRIKLAIIITIQLFIANSNCFAKTIIKKNDLFCISKEAFNNQIDFFVHGGLAIVADCSVTKEETEVIVVRGAGFGVKEVMTTDGQLRFFVNSESVITK